MSTIRQRSDAAKVLGSQGGKIRWHNLSEDERTELARQMAAKRWPSFRAALTEELERDPHYREC